jgi:hypothetical protein
MGGLILSTRVTHSLCVVPFALMLIAFLGTSCIPVPKNSTLTGGHLI